MKSRLSFIILLMSLSIAGYAQQIVLTPQWTAQSQFAGYYVAQELGFYKEAGVDVIIEHTSASDKALNRMLNKKCNAITMLLFDAMCQIDHGVELVNILQTAQRSGHVIVVRDDQIKDIEDLRGKKVGILRSNFNQLAQLIEKDYNLNIEWITFIQNINLYISGAIDATMAMTYNELYQLRASGYENKKVIYLADIGYDYPEDGLYITREYYEKYPEKAVAFAQASRRGWQWAHEHPEEALDIVMKVIEREDIPASRRHQEWMLREVLKQQIPTGESEPRFELNHEKVKALCELLVKHGRINNEINADQIKGR